MKLRSHLFLLVLGTLLPMVAFGILVTMLIADREEELFRKGAMERTLALLTAIDTELTSHSNSLQALASSRDLERDDLAGFWYDATRILPTQPHWRSVALKLPSGDRILDTRVPFDGELPSVPDGTSSERTFDPAASKFGDLIYDDNEWVFSIQVPIVFDGKSRYLLSARVSPGAIHQILTPQQLPSDWVGVVVDSNKSVVARTKDHERTVGRPASESLQAALSRGPEGWFRGSTLEGTEVYTPYNQSSSTRWSVALGIPVTAVENALSRSQRLLALGIFLALWVAGILAIALGRRISKPISSLAAMARTVAHQVPEPPANANRVDEVEEVSQTLVDAARAVRERERSLLAADAAKDEFLAMLGHELRNPLSALASAVQVLQMTSLQDETASAAQAIVARQVRHMTRLVDDLLDVNRVTRGKINLNREPVNVQDVVVSFMSDWRAAGRLDQHEVRLETQATWVLGDGARIEQIVSNLVENAVKYTPAGGWIAVKTFRRGGEVVLEVSDDGIGLSPELTPRVFDLFVQEERSLDRGLGGLGIGLTLVKGLAELHGGEVSVASDGEGLGARFAVTFPAIDPPFEVSPAPASPLVVTQPCHIVVIEDNEDARRTLVSALRLYGHTVDEAADGLSGIQAVAELRPDVAVVDIGLPGCDGYEVARRVRDLPDAQSILLVAVTGYGQNQAQQRALEAGFDEYLRKPISPVALAELIDQALSAARSGPGEPR